MTLAQRVRQAVDARLHSSYVAFVSGAIVILSLVLAVSLFMTFDRGRTAFGIPFGADFAGFYVAAKILNDGQPTKLYDRKLHHALYHELLPEEEDHAAIPYIHPPFVAGLLTPLARLPYPTAVAIWMTITASLYVAGLWVMFTALRLPPTEPRWLMLLIACSFEPFAFECWLGGQLSAVGFMSFALAFAALQRQKSFPAGLALGLSLYKPTLLILVVPLLVAGRRWRMLMGMTVTGIALAALSLVFVDWNVNVGYVNELLTFRKSSAGGDLEIRTWKYVDLNNCLRLLLGDQSPLFAPLFLILGLVPFGLLCRAWWKCRHRSIRYRRMLWATTLTWIPILNVYFGIYDSILVVQSALITATSVRSQSSSPIIDSGLAYLLSLIYLAPWFSQNLAAMTGIPIYTLLLGGLGTYQLGRLVGMRSEPLKF